MALVEESCMLSARPDPDDETSTKREIDLAQVSFHSSLFCPKNLIIDLVLGKGHGFCVLSFYYK